VRRPEAGVTPCLPIQLHRLGFPGECISGGDAEMEKHRYRPIMISREAKEPVEPFPSRVNGFLAGLAPCPPELNKIARRGPFLPHGCA